MKKNRQEKGKIAAIEGTANEHIAAGILMKKYPNVSIVDLPLSSFDIIIVLKLKDGSEDFIRAQAKTARNSIKFTGGTRGGIDRTYKSDIKEYTQTTEKSDVVIGVHPLSKESYELYFVPTILIERLDQKSISLKKVESLKNNYEILEECKNKKFIIKKCKEYKII